MKTFVNYQLKLDKIISEIEEENRVPKLLLHSCCAPCSSYVLTYLSQYFEITVYYYNPNISFGEEYLKRVEEQKRFISDVEFKHKVDFVEGPYDPTIFFDAVKGMENMKEGDRRCYICYKLRLEQAAIYAKDNGYDFFTTTLSISPYKNVAWLNEIGELLATDYDINYLYSDFKKKNGYKTSIELSKQYGLYRQDYCGCVYSKEERQKQKDEEVNKKQN